MKIRILFFLIFLGNALYAQYSMYQINTHCPNTSADEIQLLKNRMDSLMYGMMENQQLPMYSFREGSVGDTLTFSIMISAESEEHFTGIVADWEEVMGEKTLNEFHDLCPIRNDGLAFPWDHYYPALKVQWAAVQRPAHIDYTPDPETKYNIVIDFLAYSKLEEKETMDAKALNWGLSQIARLINLHVASGIPAENIHVVAAVHGYAGRSFLTDEAYKERYNIPNPNRRVINQLAEYGVDFLVCAQSLGNITREELLPEAKISLTAQTVITEYQLKGYALKSYTND